MKITGTKSKQNKSDSLSLVDNILTINGTAHDLDNLAVLPEITISEPTEEQMHEFEADKKQFLIDNPVHKDAEGNEFLNLKFDDKHSGLFINNNYELFHGKRLDGQFDRAELLSFITCWNLTEAERKAEHKALRKTFTDEQWAERVAAAMAA